MTYCWQFMPVRGRNTAKSVTSTIRMEIQACGFGIDRSIREMAPLTSNPRWIDLPAVQNGRVYVTDGNQYFNRPGPRVVESAEILAECLHPNCFDFGHQGKGWIPWDTSQT